MPAFQDLTGKQFGRLTVIRLAPKAACGRIKWLCKCFCGNTTEQQANDLVNGKVISCGCYNKERSKTQHRTHGESKTRLYTIWLNMRRRCNNEKDEAYPRYGGRGIKICQEWEVYENFKAWAKQAGYIESLTIDRIDNDAGYCPQNCRWASYAEQRKNQKRVKLYNGMTLTEVSLQTGLSYEALKCRLKRGWDVERAFTQPIKGSKNGGNKQ